MLHYFLVLSAAIEKSKSFWFVCFEVGFCYVVQASPDFWTQGVLQPHSFKIWAIGRCHHTLLFSLGWSLLTPHFSVEFSLVHSGVEFHSICFYFHRCAGFSRGSLSVQPHVCYPGSSQRFLFCTKWGGANPLFQVFRWRGLGTALFLFSCLFPPLQFSIKSLAVFLSFFF